MTVNPVALIGFCHAIGRRRDPEKRKQRCRLADQGESALRNRNLARTDLDPAAASIISELLRQLLAEVFTLYLKTKNFHWRMSGPNFRDDHLLLDEQASQIFAITDAMAQRVRQSGGRAIRSIAEIPRLRRIEDNEEESVSPESCGNWRGKAMC